MDIDIDLEVDTAYISIVDNPAAGTAVQQVSVTPPGDQGEIVLDFDRDNRLLGVEILGASQILPKAVLPPPT